MRALEQAVTDKQLVRITTDYARPIPMSGFVINAEITRSGRAASTARATVTDADGRVCATATSLHLIRSDFDNLPTTLSRGRAGQKPHPAGLPSNVHTMMSFSLATASTLLIRPGKITTLARRRFG